MQVGPVGSSRVLRRRRWVVGVAGGVAVLVLGVAAVVKVSGARFSGRPDPGGGILPRGVGKVLTAPVTSDPGSRERTVRDSDIPPECGTQQAALERLIPGSQPFRGLQGRDSRIEGSCHWQSQDRTRVLSVRIDLDKEERRSADSPTGSAISAFVYDVNALAERTVDAGPVKAVENLGDEAYAGSRKSRSNIATVVFRTGNARVDVEYSGIVGTVSEKVVLDGAVEVATGVAGGLGDPATAPVRIVDRKLPTVTPRRTACDSIFPDTRSRLVGKVGATARDARSQSVAALILPDGAASSSVDQAKDFCTLTGDTGELAFGTMRLSDEFPEGGSRAAARAFEAIRLKARRGLFPGDEKVAKRKYMALTGPGDEAIAIYRAEENGYDDPEGIVMFREANVLGAVAYHRPDNRPGGNRNDHLPRAAAINGAYTAAVELTGALA